MKRKYKFQNIKRGSLLIIPIILFCTGFNSKPQNEIITEDLSSLCSQLHGLMVKAAQNNKNEDVVLFLNTMRKLPEYGQVESKCINAIKKTDSLNAEVKVGIVYYSFGEPVKISSGGGVGGSYTYKEVETLQYLKSNDIDKEALMSLVAYRKSLEEFDNPQPVIKTFENQNLNERLKELNQSLNIEQQ